MQFNNKIAFFYNASMLLYKQGEDTNVESFFSQIFNLLYRLYFWFFILETIQIH